VLHSVLGAMVDGHLAALWLLGLTLLVPTAMLTALRFIPHRALAGLGMLRAES
jgi:sulfoxide reductase heme-binding subunit YedZ